MKHITTDELKQITAEGLVMQGCGGDPDEWLSGINDLLTEAGILRDGDTFKDAYVFEHGGLTNILFDMEDVKLDIGKLAMWRIQTHGNFGGSWLSDYLPNRLGVEMAERGTDRADAVIDSGEPEAQPATVISQEKTASGVNPPIRAYIVNTEDKTDMFAGIDRLNNGNFAGKWHSFPTTTFELQSTLKEIGVDGEKNKDYAMTDFEVISETLSYALPMLTDLNEFNYLALTLSGLTESQREVFEAVLESGRYCESVADVINLTENLDCFELQPAFDAAMLGEHLVNGDADNYGADFQKLYESEDEELRGVISYIETLEKYVDYSAYGKEYAENEQGVFTEHGYLTEAGGFKEIYHGPEDIPAMYRVFAYPEPEPLMKAEDADLCDLVLKIHALGGDYMPDARHNLNVLSDKRSSEYLMLMDGRNIFLTEAAHAYRRSTTAFDVFMNAAESPDTRAFAIHVTDMHDPRGVIGDLAEVDLAERQLDLLRHSIRFTHVDATPKFGPAQTFTPEQWEAMEPVDRHMLQEWRRQFNTDDVRTVIVHLEDIKEKHAASGRAVEPDALLADLNRIYMDKAENPQPDMLRVTLSAAKEMLARGDATVYRLMPDGPKELSPLDAMPSRDGLWYQYYREFAVKKDDLAGIGKWADREAKTHIVRNQPDRDAPEKPKSRGPEL